MHHPPVPEIRGLQKNTAFIYILLIAVSRVKQLLFY